MSDDYKQTSRQAPAVSCDALRGLNCQVEWGGLMSRYTGGKGKPSGAVNLEGCRAGSTYCNHNQQQLG